MRAAVVVKAAVVLMVMMAEVVARVALLVALERLGVMGLLWRR